MTIVGSGFVVVQHIMGTAISLHLADDLPEPVLQTLADDAFAWLREVDRRFSTYKHDSEISRLANGELTLQSCSSQVRAVLDTCTDLWQATRGYFDVYATGTLDPSGYVKGWAAQVASDRLAAAGSVNHCLNAGGDVRVRGVSPSGQPWRIGIRHPWQPQHTSWILYGTDLAVATSGVYERGHHVIDPHTGQPNHALRSVTVTGPDLGIADAYATAAMAMGPSGVDWLAALDGYETAVVCQDGRAMRSDGLPTIM